jgi:glyoxylase-like metal-dependent hydrolase (beta-lactamase superfamily II)
MMPLARSIAAVLLAVPLLSWTPNPGDPYAVEWVELARGVWAGVRPNSPRMPVLGTATFVVGTTGVLVYDGGGAPLHGQRVLEKIRSVTKLPVTHIVISHWHGDHHLGLRPLLDAYPEAQVVAHAFTRAAMLGAPMDYIEEVKGDPPALKKSFEGALATPPAEPGLRAWIEQAVADADLITEQVLAGEVIAPNVTLTDRLDIHLGDRSVELHHLGRGNTKGDVVLWLPAERILATGDMVVRPTPYGFGSYPRDWAASLRRLKTFDAAVIVPGHGDPFRGWAYVDLLIETMELVAHQVDALAAQKLPLETVRERIDFSAVEPRFTNGDPFLASRFQVWFKTPIVEAAYTLATGGETEVLERARGS